MTLISFASTQIEPLLTHNSTDKNFDLSIYEKNLRERTSLTVPLEKALDILKQLSQFELGRFLLANKGLNGYWTSYTIIHGPKKTSLTPLEKWLLNKAPSVKATQARFQIFQQQLQNYLKSESKVASIPCGLMDELLGLDYSNTKDIRITGIDLDEKSLQLAKENATKYKIDNIELTKKNAWNLGVTEEYDIITSNGLNIYEPSNEKVILLYKEFYKALKPNGILVTSFLTPPPTLSKQSPWENYSTEDALKQKVIFSDIIQATWQVFRTEAETREQLKIAGFTVIDVICDDQGIFPTVVAQKITRDSFKKGDL